MFICFPRFEQQWYLGLYHCLQLVLNVLIFLELNTTLPHQFQQSSYRVDILRWTNRIVAGSFNLGRRDFLVLHLHVDLHTRRIITIRTIWLLLHNIWVLIFILLSLVWALFILEILEYCFCGGLIVWILIMINLLFDWGCDTIVNVFNLGLWWFKLFRLLHNRGLSICMFANRKTFVLLSAQRGNGLCMRSSLPSVLGINGQRQLVLCDCWRLLVFDFHLEVVLVVNRLEVRHWFLF